MLRLRGGDGGHPSDPALRVSLGVLESSDPPPARPPQQQRHLLTVRPTRRVALRRRSGRVKCPLFSQLFFSRGLTAPASSRGAASKGNTQGGVGVRGVALSRGPALFLWSLHVISLILMRPHGPPVMCSGGRRGGKEGGGREGGGGGSSARSEGSPRRSYTGDPGLPLPPPLV